MTLENLLRIGKLKAHEPTAAEFRRLLAAIERNLADAASNAISDETRFDAAYKAVMQCALLAVMAKGFRPSNSEPGHHATLIQALPLTLGINNESWIVLDALRRKRNAADYTGDVVTSEMVEECISRARLLQASLTTKLSDQRPDLMT